MPITAKEFAADAEPAAVRQALARLAKAGKLRRIRRGLYERPRSHPIMGRTPSNPLAVVESMMKARHAPWQVSGAYAANLLGLSEQVPTQLIIKTTARVPPVILGNTRIKFARVAPSSMAGSGHQAGLVVQAVRYLGPTGMTPARVERLRQQLKPAAIRELKKLIPNLPISIQPVLKDIVSAPKKP